MVQPGAGLLVLPLQVLVTRVDNKRHKLLKASFRSYKLKYDNIFQQYSYKHLMLLSTVRPVVA